MGIDEGTALLVRDGRLGEVMGTSHVMLVDGSTQKGALVVRLARPGQTVDLAAASSATDGSSLLLQGFERVRAARFTSSFVSFFAASRRGFAAGSPMRPRA